VESNNNRKSNNPNKEEELTSVTCSYKTLCILQKMRGFLGFGCAFARNDKFVER